MNWSYRAGWILFRIILGLHNRARYLNPENVPMDGPVILASNHASFIDPPLIGCGLPRPVGFLARDSLFHYPVLGAVIRSWKAVPVDREGGGPAGLRMIMERLGSGDAILLFPEGTRTTNGELLPARSGIGLVVVKSSAPVVPVRVFGTLQAFGRHHRWPRPCPIAVKFGRPISLDGLRSESRNCSKTRLKEIYQEIAKEIMTSIGRLEACQDKMSFP